MESLPKEHSSLIYKRIVKMYQFASVLFQLDLLKENFRFNFMIYIDFLLIFHYLTSTVYTIFTKRNDIDVVLRAACLEGLNIQLLVKAITLVYYAKHIYILNKQILDVHNNVRGPYQNIMYKWAQGVMLMTKVQLVLYFLSATGFCLYPLYVYMILNEKVVIYELLLPFDDTTKNGYTVTILIQIFLTYGTTVIIFAVDLLFIVMILSGTSLFSLFECDCKMLTTAIDNLQEIKRDDTSKDNVNKLLIQCFQRSQVIYKYFNEVGTVFEKYCLIQVYSSAVTILLCVFVAKTSDWFVVYLIAISGIYQLTLYCAIGTLVEYKSEQIVKCVYDVTWYKLSVREQLMFKLLLQFVQKTITIKVMGERKLNIETGVDIYKTIYSALVMMEQFY